MEAKNKSTKYLVIISVQVCVIIALVFFIYSSKGLYMEGRLSGLRQYKEAVILYRDNFNPSVDIAQIDSNLPEKLNEIIRENEKQRQAAK